MTSVSAQTYYTPSIDDNSNHDNYTCSIDNSEIDENTSITFYGDSRGDYVDFPLYGEIPWGWNYYFAPYASNWNIQNMAVGGWRIENLYNHLIDCNLYKPPNKTFYDYTTATRYAVEIGGNDAIDQIPTLIASPWNYGKVVSDIDGGQRFVVQVLIEALKGRSIPEDQIGDRILLMGSYPTVAHGPVSGFPKDQFCDSAALNNCANSATLGYYDFYDLTTQQSTLKQLEEFLSDLVSYWPKTMVTEVGAAIQQIYSGDPDTNYSSDPAMNAYLKWVHYVTDEGSVFTTASMVLMNLSSTEKEIASDYGIQHVDLYSYIAYPPDCNLGACWTADPEFFRDLIHPNWKGYAAIGNQIGPWLASHGWDVVDYPPSKMLDPGKLGLLKLLTAKSKALDAKVNSSAYDVSDMNGKKGLCLDVEAYNPNDPFKLSQVPMTICAGEGMSEAHMILGDIRTYYLGKGGLSWYSYPISDELVRGLGGVDRCQNFEMGYIYWSPIHGIRDVVANKTCPD